MASEELDSFVSLLELLTELEEATLLELLTELEEVVLEELSSSSSELEELE